jgi:hypothetical protein
MSAITVQTEDGRRHVRPGASAFAELVSRIGGRGDRFLVVQRVPYLPDVFAQVWHEAGGDYTLEHRAGAPDRHFRTALEDLAPVIAAMTGWARLEDGWDAGLRWSQLDFPPVAPVPPLHLPEEELQALRARVRTVLVGGYATRAELAELAEEYLVRADRRPVSPEQAWQLVDRMWLRRVGEQAHWNGETDPERLSGAFAVLDAAGDRARENFACCRSCGDAEIGAAGAPDARGYVYFHSQCTDAAASGHGLMLLHGGFDASPERSAAVARQIVSALEEHGLPARWSGDVREAIEFAPLDWSRRLVG